VVDMGNNAEVSNGIHVDNNCCFFKICDAERWLGFGIILIISAHWP